MANSTFRASTNGVFDDHLNLYTSTGQFQQRLLIANPDWGTGDTLRNRIGDPNTNDPPPTMMEKAVPYGKSCCMGAASTYGANEAYGFWAFVGDDNMAQVRLNLSPGIYKICVALDAGTRGAPQVDNDFTPITRAGAELRVQEFAPPPPPSLPPPLSPPPLPPPPLGPAGSLYTPTTNPFEECTYNNTNVDGSQGECTLYVGTLVIIIVATISGLTLLLVIYCCKRLLDRLNCGPSTLSSSFVAVRTIGMNQAITSESKFKRVSSFNSLRGVQVCCALLLLCICAGIGVGVAAAFENGFQGSNNSTR